MSKKPKVARVAPAKTGKTSVTKISAKPDAKQAPGSDSKRSLPPRTVKGTVRENSKQAQLIEMLGRTSGTTIQQLMDMTGWQQHSIRGFLSGTVKKKLGLKILSDKTKDGVRTYRIKAA